MKSLCLVCRVSTGFNQSAIRNNLKLVIHRSDQLARSLVVRVVVTRKPIVIGSRFTLRPDLIGPSRISFRRRDEGEPLLWCRGVADRDRNVLRFGIQMIERNVKLLVVRVAELKRRAAGKLD